MWVFLIIVFFVAALLWQIPGIGPLLSILFIAGLVALFWLAMKPRKDGRSTTPPKREPSGREPTLTLRIESSMTDAERKKHDEQIRKIDEWKLRSEAGKVAGQVEGTHYLEWAPVVTKLNQEGNYEEALALCLELIDATERQAKIEGNTPPPGYTNRAAILYRRLKDYDGEIAVLERFMKHKRYPDMEERLVRAKFLRDKASGK